MGVQAIKFKLVEVKAGINSEHFVEGFVSTSDPDLFDDVVTPEAQEKILSQLVNFDITMDDDHDTWRDPKTGEEFSRPQNKIPVAQIVHAELRELEDNSVGTWVRVQLNKNYPFFDKVLNSIREGFLHSFSIAYNVIDKAFEKVGQKTLRIIKDLVVFNAGITGIPVNTNAKFQLALKSINKMGNQENKPKEDPNPQDDKEDVSKENEDLKTQLKSVQEELDSIKSVRSTEKKSLETSEAKFSELKSQVDELSTLKKEFAELKSIVEKVKNTPINSAQMKSLPQDKSTATEIDFKSLIGGLC